MEYRIFLSDLYDVYGNLLTEKQQIYFEDYYFNNLSLTEIAENNEVSRNAVHKQIKESENKLLNYEQILKNYEKSNKIKELLNLIEDKKIKEEILKLL